MHVKLAELKKTKFRPIEGMHKYNLLIFESQWLHLVSNSLEKFEFYEYKMYLDVEIAALNIV